MSSKKPPANKPKTEKKRRARINQSLEKMKFLIPEAKRLSAIKPGRIEKAEILEIAVHFIEESLKGSTPEDGTSAAYRAGFARCISDIRKFATEKHQDVDEILAYLFKRMDDPTPIDYEKPHFPETVNGHMPPKYVTISPQTPSLMHRYPFNRGVTCHCTGSPTICRPVPVVQGLPGTPTSVPQHITRQFHLEYSPQAAQCNHSLHNRDISCTQAPSYCPITPDILSL